jgi:hypothetical protein
VSLNNTFLPETPGMHCHHPVLFICLTVAPELDIGVRKRTIKSSGETEASSAGEQLDEG